jgi:orotate phosphoribosyltransferase
MRQYSARVVAQYLQETGAVQVNTKEPFKLHSGKYSPIYINCRKLLSSPFAMSHVTLSFHQLLHVHAYNPKVIAGGETAGIPFAIALAYTMHKPAAYVRKVPKDYGGRGSLVEGADVKGATTFLVEDIITDGGSKLEFIKTLREAGAIVDYCFVVLDRDQGGQEKLQEYNVQLESLCSMEVLMEQLFASDLGTAEKKSLSSYLQDPDGWEKTN